MFKTVDDMQKLGKNRIEAVTASAAAVSRGLQQIAAETSAYSKKSLEDGSAAMSRMMGVKSLDGAAAVQANYAKASFEGLVAQAGKMGALFASVGRDAAKPFDGAMGGFKQG